KNKTSTEFLNHALKKLVISLCVILVVDLYFAFRGHSASSEAKNSFLRDLRLLLFPQESSYRSTTKMSISCMNHLKPYYSLYKDMSVQLDFDLVVYRKQNRRSSKE